MGIGVLEDDRLKTLGKTRSSFLPQKFAFTFDSVFDVASSSSQEVSVSSFGFSSQWNLNFSSAPTAMQVFMSFSEAWKHSSQHVILPAHCV